jgi:YkoY family integral membrane protein
LFGQTFELRDLFVISLLVVLEGVLSIDNALVLGLLAKRLPKHLQARALTYGLVGAFVFRILAIALAGFLLSWQIPKLLGGLYLLWVAFKEFVLGNKAGGADPDKLAAAEQALESHDEAPGPEYAIVASTHTWAFWSTVAVIELTDIAFAVDSILAAVGTVPGRNKLWIVVTGGMLGVALMRFAAVIFIRLLERFPRFETSAYLLVAVIGMKLVLDYVIPILDFHDAHHPAFWIFWGSMLGCFCFGFLPQKRDDAPTQMHSVE